MSAYEKPPTPKKAKPTNPEMAIVTLEKAEKNIDLQRMVGVYKAEGYVHMGVNEEGSILMGKPKDQAIRDYKESQQVARRRLGDSGNTRVLAGQTKSYVQQERETISFGQDPSVLDRNEAAALYALGKEGADDDES